MAFWQFFFLLFFVVSVVFAIFFFLLIFLPFQPSKEKGAFGRIWSVLTSNASSARAIFLWQIFGLLDYFLL